MRAALVLALTAGCYAPNAATGVPCSANFECPGAQLCDRHQSPPTCVTSLPLDGPASLVDARLDDAAILDAPPDAMGGGSLFVREVTGTSLTGATLEVTFSSAPASGNTLVVVGAANQGPLVSVTGGGVTSWTRAASSKVNCDIEIWFGTTQGGDPNIDLNLAGNNLPMWADVSEWSGVVTSFPKDNARANSGTAASASAGNLPTSHAHDLVIFGAVGVTPNTFGIPMPGIWTPLMTTDASNCGQSAWWKEVTATGMQSASVSDTSNMWEAAIVALKIAP